MSASNQEDYVALVSVDERLPIGELLNATNDAIGFEETQERLELAQGVL